MVQLSIIGTTVSMDIPNTKDKSPDKKRRIEQDNDQAPSPSQRKNYEDERQEEDKK